MRILAVGNLFPPHHLGGYELVWRDAVEHLRGRGHAVRVLTSGHHEAGVTPAPQTEVYRELDWYWRDHAFPRTSLAARLRLERHNAAVLDRHLHGFAPDVVTWWAMGGMSLSLLERVRRRGTPAVAFVNDDWLVYGPRTDAWLRIWAHRGVPARLVERLTGLPTTVAPQRCARLVFASESLRRAAGEPDGEVVYGGIGPEFLDASKATPRRWDWSLLYVGRIDRRKGIDTAIQALRHLPNQATLKIVGAGDEAHARELRDLAEPLGDRVCFAGPRPRAELPAAYRAADAVVFPARWEEPWGLVPLEAMGCGTPVVATVVGGAAEYLRDGENCLAFARDNPAGLAAAVRRLAGDGDLQALLAANGLRTAERYTAAAFNARVEQLVVGAGG